MTAIEKMEQALTKSADMLAIEGKKLCETEGVLSLLRMLASSCRELASEEKSKPAPVEANKCGKCSIRNTGRADRKTGNCHKCFFQDSWTWNREEYCDPSNCPRLTGNFNCEEKP